MGPPATVLMVAEKPSLAKSIAEFLSEGRVRSPAMLAGHACRTVPPAGFWLALCCGPWSHAQPWHHAALQYCP